MADGGDSPDWAWFPRTTDSWSLDIVSLLAVIGEATMAEHAQAITASRACFLPRILPAPQALLRAVRPARMPDVPAKLVGVHSGIVLESIGFFANIITPLEGLAPYSFTVFLIRHRTGKPQSKKRIPAEKEDEEHGPARNGSGGHGSEPAPVQHPRPPRQQSRQDTIDANTASLRRRLTRAFTRTSTQSPEHFRRWSRPAIPARTYSPIHILSVASFLLSAAIIAAAAVWRDGVAILAVALVSLAGTVVGLASHWKPVLMHRVRTSQVPEGDVVIRTREGAFLLVRCTEEVARELYAGTEECEYTLGNRAYRLLMAVGTVLLMLSVVLLGNCSWNSQMFIGGSYIVLNGLYWGLGMLPQSYFWDLSRYEWDDVTPPDARDSGRGGAGDGDDPGTLDADSVPSFTRALWYAIRETGKTGWVQRSGAAPLTPQWERWLAEAQAVACGEVADRAWRAVARKDAIMNGAVGSDNARQTAPATEVGVLPATGPAAGA